MVLEPYGLYVNVDLWGYLLGSCCV